MEFGARRKMELIEKPAGSSCHMDTAGLDQEARLLIMSNFWRKHSPLHLTHVLTHPEWPCPSTLCIKSLVLNGTEENSILQYLIWLIRKCVLYLSNKNKVQAFLGINE